MTETTHDPLLVSCIVPVFNGERYLDEALRSLLAQTAGPPEVIVVDDGSTDATAEILASYADRVRAVRQENAGPATARNRGLRLARGQLISFLDSDDLWEPAKLERQLAFLAARPEVHACVTHAQNFWIPELQSEAETFREHRIAKPMPAFLASTLLARRAIFDRVGGFDETLRFGDSTDWFLRAARCGVKVAMLPEVLYSRRIHERNRSRVHGPNSREEFLALVKRHLDERRAVVGGDAEPSASPDRDAAEEARSGRRRI